MISCNDKAGKISLLKTTTLNNYPSGSSVEIFDDLLYVIGDDASEISIIDKDYNAVPAYKDKPIYRIPKEEKLDFEASTIVYKEGKPFLLVVGSGSKENREKALMVPLPYSAAIALDTIDNSPFIKSLSKTGIPEVNIEGLAATNQHLVFANRANLNNPVNHLIFTHLLLGQTNTPTPIIKKIVLPATNNVIGVSGLAYDSENDVLLFTASTEEAVNATTDGAIGDSYIGYIRNISNNNKEEIIVDAFVNLTKEDKAFKGEKIESVCIESVDDNNYVLHLVSDNDNGKTKLFKINYQVKN